MMIVKITFETESDSIDVNEIINVINRSSNKIITAFKINVQDIPKISYPINLPKEMKKENKEIEDTIAKAYEKEFKPIDRKDSLLGLWKTEDGQFVKITNKYNYIDKTVWYGKIPFSSNGYEYYYDDNGNPLEFVDGVKLKITGKLIKRRLSDFDKSENWPISAAPLA